ncbi:MAG: hypothetical protein H6648_06790 [Caldilineae bacterium]|nr:hypothetical protein [Chloroflexota bacterium]MCB9176852.1 hypothetical protein [Caldilineae bacterium]
MSRPITPSRTARIAAGLGWLFLLAAAMTWGNQQAAAAPAEERPDDTILNDEIFYGRLQNGRPGCAGAEDALLVFCDGAETLSVQSLPGVNLRTLFGQSVAIRGNLLECGNGERYIALNSIEPTRRCEPQATVEPPQPNLALHAPVVANTHIEPNLAQNATDGDLLSYWYAPGRDAWIYLDLGPNIDPDGDGEPAATTFNEARLVWGERYAVQYGIYVFDPVEGRWVRIYQKSDGSMDETISFPRALGRYVLLQLARSSAPEGGYALREVELYGIDTPNLTLGSQSNASSAQAGMPAWQAVDGNERTAWASESGDLTPWIYARIPSGAALTEFRLLWDQAAMPAMFRVGFYQDGEIKIWSQRFQSTNASQRLAWGQPIECEAFYVYVEQTGAAGFVQLQELALYGPAGGRPLGSGLDRAEAERFGWPGLIPRLMLGLRQVSERPGAWPGRIPAPIPADAAAWPDPRD